MNRLVDLQLKPENGPIYLFSLLTHLVCSVQGPVVFLYKLTEKKIKSTHANAEVTIKT